MSGKLTQGLRQGGGPPPGYRWSLWLLRFVRHEAMKFLDEAQYAHLAEQFQELARQADPTRSQTISIGAIEDFYELRDKGGVLRSLNVRVFYYVDDCNRSIVVLGAIVKQNDGPTLLQDKIRMRMRLRNYLADAFGTIRAESKGN